MGCIQFLGAGEEGTYESWGPHIGWGPEKAVGPSRMTDLPIMFSQSPIAASIPYDDIGI